MRRLTSMPTDWSDGDTPFVEIPSSQVTLVRVKLMETNHHRL